MYPIKLVPVFKETIWGGNKIKEIYGKNTPCDKIGESWEASAIPGGVSTIFNGRFSGMGLMKLPQSIPGKFWVKSVEMSFHFALK